MTAQLRGVLTALATPFAQDGYVDEASLRALADRSVTGGVHGVVACGSTGEVSALSSDERRLVVETVVDHVAGRIPVIAQTGATSTAEAIRLSRHAQAAGADVIMAVAPYYEPLTIDEPATAQHGVSPGAPSIPSAPPRSEPPWAKPTSCSVLAARGLPCLPRHQHRRHRRDGRTSRARSAGSRHRSPHTLSWLARYSRSAR
jgi:Dihydrodipicolinate synthetase family